jgi:hypothetical protein
MGGAEHLARIHGTEEDKVNCPFYFKIGACRHGEKCSRQHHRPPFSETILVRHMFNNPMCGVVSSGGDINQMNPDALQDCLDDFYEVRSALLCSATGELLCADSALCVYLLCAFVFARRCSEPSGTERGFSAFSHSRLALAKQAQRREVALRAFWH